MGVGGWLISTQVVVEVEVGVVLGNINILILCGVETRGFVCVLSVVSVKIIERTSEKRAQGSILKNITC